MRLHYDIVDVFTERPFAGNQLAVVHGAADLTSEQCLAITREFGFSETTFPAAVENATEYATRIFTPDGEIPFAGHPTLGTAWVLREAGRLTGPDATQLCGAGRIALRFEEESVELAAAPRDRVGPLSGNVVPKLLRDVGLSVADLAGEVWVAGCGLSFVHVPVTEEAVVRAQVPTRPLEEHTEQIAAAAGELGDPLGGINLVAISGAAPTLRVHSRVLHGGTAAPEDPATGSAAVGLGIALVEAGLLPEGGRYTISQGLEMGRPSTLRGRVDAEHGSATRCYVAGQVQPVAHGEIVVPLS